MTDDFHIAAAALLLYHREQYSLFADQAVSDELKIPLEVIYKKVVARFGCDVSELISILKPDRIKHIIEKTSKRMEAAKEENDKIIITQMRDEVTGRMGENLQINFNYADSPYGRVIVASTDQGVCSLVFADKSEDEALKSLEKKFPGADFQRKEDSFQKAAIAYFTSEGKMETPIHLHLKGTVFQIKVWKRLLKIPCGGLMSYSALAGNRKDSHAFGNGVGRNPIAYIIPCHRAVPASGKFGEYHWGKARKAAMICEEALKEG